MYPRSGNRLPRRPKPMSDARFVGRVEQPDPYVPEFGVPRRRLREAHPRHQRPAAAPVLPRRQRPMIGIAVALPVFPAKAGTNLSLPRTTEAWVPAFAGNKIKPLSE